MERPAAVRITADGTKAVSDVLKAAKSHVTSQLRALGAKKLAKAYPRPGEPGFDPNPPSIPPPDPVDPAAIAAVTFDLDAFDELEEGAFTDALTQMIEDAEMELLGEVGLDDDQEIVDQVFDDAVQAAKEQAAELVTNIDESTRQMLRDVIANGLQDNIGLDAIIDNIAQSPIFSEDRAELIARTEIRNANERGVLKGLFRARDAGNEMLKEWMLGPNPCEICIENADAGPIPLDDVFPSGDSEPTAHPRCECSITGAMAEPQSESDQGDEDAVEALARFAGATLHKEFDPGEARDEHGEWTSGFGAIATHVSDPANAEKVAGMAKIASGVASDLHYDPALITVSDETKTFELNGKSYNYAGAAFTHDGSGKIVLYATQMNDKTAAGIAAHEIEHQKFQAFMNDYKADYARMEQDPDYLDTKNKDFMRADGTLKEPYAARYPAYQTYTQAMAPGIYDGFSKSDGVSDYSAEYWKGYITPNSGIRSDQAMHETLAEIARLKQEGGSVEHRKLGEDLQGNPAYFRTTAGIGKLDPMWANLYRAVDDNWKRRS